MSFIWEGIIRAFHLLSSLDPEVMGIVWVSLKVSGLATLFASLVGIPLGVSLAGRRFPLRQLVVTLLNTSMALPTVVVGLFVYALISRQGPLGGFDLLFTIPAMVIGEFLLILPIVSALSLAAAQGVDIRVRMTALSLGASPFQASISVMREARFGLMAAVVAGFGRAIAEVGSAMILGGNIKGFTRTMTTAIALETSKGEFALAIALGVILLLLAFGINIIFYQLHLPAPSHWSGGQAGRRG